MKRGEYNNYKAVAKYRINGNGAYTLPVYFTGVSARSARPALMAQVRAVSPKVTHIRLGRVLIVKGAGA